MKKPAEGYEVRELLPAEARAAMKVYFPEHARAAKTFGGARPKRQFKTTTKQEPKK